MDPTRGVEVVTVHYIRPQKPQKVIQVRRTLGHGERVWGLALLDVMAMAWMASAGSWLDQASGFTAVITLGGHHKIAFALAVISFAILAVLAVTTEGFSRISAMEIGFLSVAGVLTVVALAGLLSVVLLVVGAGFFLGLVGRLLIR
jgi:hypothetical protein